ncbi:M48 family metallopeptidase [Candidatus Vampirococcus lugosii]|uniref:Metal-dependent hydrolase n=1 Tax=Candidatus Vampirococcus lugosii TaxID=2789015 RepID=A0ABS5QM10_9BACT|nr:SprT family zinc-dependent metalloprotease [Candidatus Vampirococcus lugosii]MBS8122245.1 putative metal-dependent hydrolase [Candidatus Vampirococcus lugosii]MBS8122250.1 putative metal-dependent hydrolase [Candidatus Vampirococcus lugosii]
MKDLIINNEKIPINIIKSPKRKSTLSFRMTCDGLIIRSPVDKVDKLINEFLYKRQDWIYKNWLVQKNNKTVIKKYVSGETFLYKGKKYILKVIQGNYKGCKIEFNNSFFFAYIDENISDKIKGNYIKLELDKWYKNKSKEIIKKEAEKIIKLYNFDVNKIIIKSYKSKYGQCKANDIYFNYLIIKFPLGIIKHIILHELCHIEHKNHSKNFWNLLSVLDKNCKENRKWIKENGNLD